MTWRLSYQDADFSTAFERLRIANRDTAPDLSNQVQKIIEHVRAEGDLALASYTHRFDRTDRRIISLAERDKWAAQVPKDQRKALQLAKDRIWAFHEHQRPENLSYTDPMGLHLGYRWAAVECAGLYVPGGRAVYPSSMLMAGIPARVAGVGKVIMCVPTPDGAIAPLVMAAAQLLEVETIFAVGGAQAIAAMAYGTETIPQVDVIVGPGNAYVAEAKRQVVGQVGIDMIAGPSEILVIADAAQNPNWIAADLLSQCEHDPSAQAILISPSLDLLNQVALAVETQLSNLPTQSVAQKSWQTHGALIETRDLDQAAALSDQLAPEHLELAVADPNALFAKVRHAGSVFLGAYTPEPLGDYLAGPNHILPTMRTARFSSGLGVQTFMKRTTFLSAKADALTALGPATRTLAEAEGLPAHAAAIAVRTNA